MYIAMPSSIASVLLLGGAVLLVLLLEPLRKLCALLIAIALAFAVAWFWAKGEPTYGVPPPPAVSAQSKP